MNFKGHFASRTEIVTREDGGQQIIVTEIPYGVNKSALVYSIDKLRHDKTLPGIEEVRDETDKTGLRIAIDIKSGYKPEPILAYLNQKTLADLVCTRDDDDTGDPHVSC